MDIQRETVDFTLNASAVLFVVSLDVISRQAQRATKKSDLIAAHFTHSIDGHFDFQLSCPKDATAVLLSTYHARYQHEIKIGGLFTRDNKTVLLLKNPQ